MIARSYKRIEIIADGTLGSVENSLRHACHLLELTPENLRPLVGLAIDPRAFEALLEHNDFDAAACHLIVQPAKLGTEGEAGFHPMRATIRYPSLKPC